MTLEIRDGIGWKDDPNKPGWKTSVHDSDYVAEIEQLRSALKNCMEHVPAYIEERYRHLIV